MHGFFPLAIGGILRWLGIFFVFALVLGLLDRRSPSGPATGHLLPLSAPRLPASGGGIPSRHESARGGISPAAPSSRLWQEIVLSSSGSWRARWEKGALTQLSGARLKGEGGSPESSAALFLGRFGSLLGISARDLQLEKARMMEQNSQVIYGQVIHGLPVFGSRVNIVLDGEQNIIYLSIRAFTGASPPAPVPVSAARAASAASAALQQFLVSRGESAGFPSEEELEPLARLGYELSGDKINLIYLFVVTVAGGLPGELEIAVNGIDGTPIRVRSLSRK